jgi:hypothetical protein
MDMTEDNRPLSEQTKSKLLTVPIQPGYMDTVEKGASLENRSTADYIRNCLLRDLQGKGLLNGEYQPVWEAKVANG